MKKKALVLCVCVLCLLAVAAAIIIKNSTVIGSIQGAELETVIIGDTVYQYDSSLEFTQADKGRFLGVVTNGKDKFRVYSVKGDIEGQYIYRLWGYDGAFYAKTD